MMYLAQFNKDNGEYSAATEYCSRLLDLGYQEATGAKALLHEMRIISGKHIDAAEARAGELGAEEKEVGAVRRRGGQTTNW